MPKKHSRKPAAKKRSSRSPQPATEPMLRQLARMLETGESSEVVTIDDLKPLMTSLKSPQASDRFSDVKADAKAEAQQIAFDAMEAENGAKARKLAKRALALDADCVDALVVLAEMEAKTPDEQLAGLQAAVAAGERSLGASFIRQNRGHFWLILETRPYMRAMAQLAEAQRGHGDFADAVKIYEKVLELNPNDNQGVRDPLLYLYLERGDLKGAQRLLRQFKEDGSASFEWARVLERFLAGDRTGASMALKRARRTNPHVELFLTLRESAKESPEIYSSGSKEEAVLIMNWLCGALVVQQEACSWVLDQLAADGLPPAPSARALKRVRVVGKIVQ